MKQPHDNLGVVFADGDVLDRAVVPPRKEVDLYAGIYEDIIPEPNFNVEWQGGGSRITAARVRSDAPGEYTILYRITNRGQQPVSVILREGTSA